MERETKTIQTPGEKELVLYQYITARDRNRVFKALIGDKPVTDEDSELEFSMDVLLQGSEELLKAIVVSYNGTKDYAVDQLLDSDPVEYDFAVKEALDIFQGFLAESSANTSGDDSTPSVQAP